MESIFWGPLWNVTVDCWWFGREQWDLQDWVVLPEGLVVALEVWKGVEHIITNYNVIPFLNEDFMMAFGQEEVNQQAISDHGWGPLNRKLLEHPHLLSQKCCEFASNHREFSGVNVENAEGMAALVIDRIVRERVNINFYSDNIYFLQGITLRHYPENCISNTSIEILLPRHHNLVTQSLSSQHVSWGFCCIKVLKGVGWSLIMMPQRCWYFMVQSN